VGFANNGNLQNARLLAEGPALRYLPGRPLHWGTDELVSLLQRVSRSLHARFAIRLTVGDLSARDGGAVGHHRSHQSGRDADIAFFIRTAPPRGTTRPGRPAEPDDYYIFGADGRSEDGRWVFDDDRNWALVSALLTDRTTRVERIFVSSPLRSRLLRYARAMRVNEALVNQAANTLVQPANVSPHNNHFHIRIGCPDSDRPCREGVWQPVPRPLRRGRAVAARRAAHPRAHPVAPRRTRAR